MEEIKDSELLNRPNVLNIELEEGQKVFFTSDQHFGHRNILRFKPKRLEQFKDVSVMDSDLSDNWNEMVGENDYVFVLGDMFWFHGRHDIKRIVNKLNGIKYVVPGNHDEIKAFELSDIIVLGDICQLFIHYKDNQCKTDELWLSHYPLLTWPHIKEGSIQLFGHIHSEDESEMREFGSILPIVKGQQLDVGVDRHKFKPISLEQVKEKLKKQKDWRGVRTREDILGLGFLKFKDE